MAWESDRSTLDLEIVLKELRRMEARLTAKIDVGAGKAEEYVFFRRDEIPVCDDGPLFDEEPVFDTYEESDIGITFFDERPIFDEKPGESTTAGCGVVLFDEETGFNAAGDVIFSDQGPLFDEEPDDITTAGCDLIIFDDEPDSFNTVDCRVVLFDSPILNRLNPIGASAASTSDISTSFGQPTVNTAMPEYNATARQYRTSTTSSTAQGLAPAFGGASPTMDAAASDIDIDTHANCSTKCSGRAVDARAPVMVFAIPTGAAATPLNINAEPSNFTYGTHLNCSTKCLSLSVNIRRPHHVSSMSLIRPKPWPFLISSNVCAVNWDGSALWKPPWPLQPQQNVRALIPVYELPPLLDVISDDHACQVFASAKLQCSVSSYWGRIAGLCGGAEWQEFGIVKLVDNACNSGVHCQWQSVLYVSTKLQLRLPKHVKENCACDIAWFNWDSMTLEYPIEEFKPGGQDTIESCAKCVLLLSYHSSTQVIICGDVKLSSIHGSKWATTRKLHYPCYCSLCPHRLLLSEGTVAATDTISWSTCQVAAGLLLEFLDCIMAILMSASYLATSVPITTCRTVISVSFLCVEMPVNVGLIAGLISEPIIITICSCLSTWILIGYGKTDWDGVQSSRGVVVNFISLIWLIRNKLLTSGSIWSSVCIYFKNEYIPSDKYYILIIYSLRNMGVSSIVTKVNLSCATSDHATGIGWKQKYIGKRPKAEIVFMLHLLAKVLPIYAPSILVSHYHDVELSSMLCPNSASIMELHYCGDSSICPYMLLVSEDTVAAKMTLSWSNLWVPEAWTNSKLQNLHKIEFIMFMLGALVQFGPSSVDIQEVHEPWHSSDNDVAIVLCHKLNVSEANQAIMLCSNETTQRVYEFIASCLAGLHTKGWYYSHDCCSVQEVIQHSANSRFMEFNTDWLVVWDPGGVRYIAEILQDIIHVRGHCHSSVFLHVCLYRLEGKPNFKKGGMLGTLWPMGRAAHSTGPKETSSTYKRDQASEREEGIVNQQLTEQSYGFFYLDLIYSSLL